MQRGQKSSMRRRSPTDRERRREQQRRHRQREREGLRTYLVDLDGQIVKMLVRLRWLTDGAAGDDQEVGRAWPEQLARLVMELLE
jgi:hypothetical protein